MGLQNQIPICNCYRTHLRVLLAEVSNILQLFQNSCRCRTHLRVLLTGNYFPQESILSFKQEMKDFLFPLCSGNTEYTMRTKHP